MTNDIVVQDNFLDAEYFQHLQNQILDKSFPWTVSTIHEELSTTDYQLCHGVCHTTNGQHFIVSSFYDELPRLFEQMDMLCCLRVKINLLKKETKPLEHPLHLDWYNSPDNLLTSILYFNTNNGYTRFEDGTKIDSVANRLITFSNNIKHGGAVNTCDAIHRCVMNINWIKKVV